MGPEMIFIILLALVLFGPKKLPELSRTIGRAVREYRRAQNELKATLQFHMSELEKESESIRDITRNFNNDIYNNYYDSHSYGSRSYGSGSWEPAASASASRPAIESSTAGASATEGAQSDSPVEANEGQLAVNGTIPRGLPAPVEPAAQTPAASPVES